MPKSILVTGGLGFIGSHTVVQLLLMKKYHVIVFDNLINCQEETRQHVEELGGASVDFVKGDLNNRSDLENLFKKYQGEIVAVMHLAALKAVGDSVKMPLLYYQNNISGTITLLQVMQEMGVKNLIFSSSATVYGSGPCPATGFVEDTPVCFPSTSPYGTSKIMMEQILIDQQKSQPDWTVILLRYFNPIGAHPSRKIGEISSEKSANIMPILNQVLRGERPELSVFGNDYNTRDGTAVRDYLHVVDLADGHVAALQLMNRPGTHIYNLGTGFGSTVLELIKAMENATGRKIPYKIVARREGDQEITIGDVTKVKKDLGWSAKFSIEEACKHSWEWGNRDKN